MESSVLDTPVSALALPAAPAAGAETWVSAVAPASSAAGERFWATVRSTIAFLVPVLLTAAVLAVAIGARLEQYGGNISGFVKFGAAFTSYTHPPSGAVVGTGASAEGYDGQFYYEMARDPLLLHDSTVRSLLAAPQNVPRALFASHNQGYRLRRVGYPAASFLLGHALGLTLPVSMLAVNVITVLALTVGMTWYARRRGWSTLWALSVSLLPGLLLATRRDLADPLAVAAAVGALVAWSGRHRRVAVALLILAVLTREVMVTAVLAIALEAGVRAWRERGAPGALRRIVRHTWPAVVLPALAFGGWELYINLRSGGISGGAGLTLPMLNFVHELKSFGSVPAGMAAWEAVYLLLMLVALGISLYALRSECTVATAGAALFGLTVLVAPFNDIWGNARDSLPMLVLLLVAGLQLRVRPPLYVCVAAATMTAFIPLATTAAF